MNMDPIAEMLTRMRNAYMVKHDKTTIPFSKQKESIARILKEEGFIVEYKTFTKDGKKNIVVFFKYHPITKECAIRGLRRISKPGSRIYVGVQEIPRVLKGLGIAILSTPKGLMSDKNCRKEKVGGEVLCYAW